MSTSWMCCAVHVDYSAEIECLISRGWVVCEPALEASRRLRFGSPLLARLMGDVWTEIDRWVEAGRPQLRWGPLDPNTAEGRLSHALVVFYMAEYWLRLG